MNSKIVCKRGKIIEICDVYCVVSPFNFNTIGFSRFQNIAYTINNFDQHDLLILNKCTKSDSGMRLILKYK